MPMAWPLGLHAALVLRLALWGCLPSLARAEIFRVASGRIPSSWELDVDHVFFVYGKEDAPAGDDEATVTFKGFGFNTADASMQSYAGLEVSVVKYEDFLVHPTNFCCTESDWRQGTCAAKDRIRFGASDEGLPGVFKHPISFTDKPESMPPSRRIIDKTGVYVLVLSNCGLLDVAQATLSGSIEMKNPYGYLSGIDYFKLPFYMWASVAYVVLTLFWLILCLRFRSELFNIQRCIGVVSACGFLECVFWFIHYLHWNKAGTRLWPIFGCAILFSVVKSIFSYMLLLVGCMGWGITTPTLSRSTITRIAVCTVLYTVLDLVRLLVMTGKDSERLPSALVLGVLLPLAILNGIIVYWVFGSLGKSIQKLTDNKQDEKLKHFQCLWRVILFAVLLEVAGQFCEVATLSRSIEVQWQTQWMFADGVSHVIFLIVLLAMMCLWRPHSETQRYAYSAQLDDQDKDQDVAPASASPPAEIVGTTAV